MLHHCYSFKTTYNTSKHTAPFCFALPCFAFTRNVKIQTKVFRVMEKYKMQLGGDKISVEVPYVDTLVVKVVYPKSLSAI